MTAKEMFEKEDFVLDEYCDQEENIAYEGGCGSYIRFYLPQQTINISDMGGDGGYAELTPYTIKAIQKQIEELNWN